MYLREYYQADQNLNLKTLTNNTYVGIKTNKKLALGVGGCNFQLGSISFLGILLAISWW